MIHCNWNFVNSRVMLNTGRELEKQLELQNNDMLVKYRFLEYMCRLSLVCRGRWACHRSNSKVNFRMVEIQPLICNIIVIFCVCKRLTKNK